MTRGFTILQIHSLLIHSFNRASGLGSTHRLRLGWAGEQQHAADHQYICARLSYSHGSSFDLKVIGGKVQNVGLRQTPGERVWIPKTTGFCERLGPRSLKSWARTTTRCLDMDNIFLMRTSPNHMSSAIHCFPRGAPCRHRKPPWQHCKPRELQGTRRWTTIVSRLDEQAGILLDLDGLLYHRKSEEDRSLVEKRSWFVVVLLSNSRRSPPTGEIP